MGPAISSVTDRDSIRVCTATAIPFIYSFSGNSTASAPISTFMCLWAIYEYIFPESVHIFPPAEKADPSWEYIIRTQTHECGNWDWGPDIPFLGIFVSNFRHFVFAVCSYVTSLGKKYSKSHTVNWQNLRILTTVASLPLHISSRDSSLFTFDSLKWGLESLSDKYI